MSVLKSVSSSKWLLLSFILGTVSGIVFGESISWTSYLGLIFLNLIKMVTMPLIFFTIIYGITGINDSAGLRRVSVKAISIFLLSSFIAVSIGLISAIILKPGNNIDLPIANSASLSSPPPSLTNGLIKIIPTNIIAALAEGNILQVIAFSFFLGAILHINRNSCQDLIKVCRQVSHLFFQMIEKIMLLAPIGVFGYIASMVGNAGANILITASKLILTVCAGCSIQYFVFGLMILICCKMSPIPFYRKMLNTQLLAFSTSSSKATLVPLMKVMESKMGVSHQSSSFILPLSAALNMDGGAIYQSICAIFFSQALGIELSLVDYCILIMMCTVASIGSAGIPGGVLLFLGMVLQSVGIPVDGFLFIASIDRILDMITTVINITGDACITLLIDHSEKSLNKEIYHAE